MLRVMWLFVLLMMADAVTVAIIIGTVTNTRQTTLITRLFRLSLIFNVSIGNACLVHVAVHFHYRKFILCNTFSVFFVYREQKNQKNPEVLFSFLSGGRKSPAMSIKQISGLFPFCSLSQKKKTLRI